MDWDNKYFWQINVQGQKTFVTCIDRRAAGLQEEVGNVAVSF